MEDQPIVVSAVDALEAKKEKKRKQDREAQQRKRDRERAARAKEGDPELLAKLEELDKSEEFYHKSECRPRAELYRLYIEHAAGEKILGRKKSKLSNSTRPDREGRERTFEQWLRLRDLFRKNLYLLCKLIIRMDLIYAVHKPVTDVFVKKNFDNIYYDGYTRDDIKLAFERMRETRKKDALLLDPRGFFKSTINGGDIVQWILACPDVRIFLMSGEHGLATKFARSVKRQFFLPEGGKKTDMHMLYPEFILTGVAGTSREPLECPARIVNMDDPTVMFSSIVSQNTGRHSDVLKLDDVVTNLNSATEDTREKIRDLVDDLDNQLLPYGFKDAVGTRYYGGKDPDYYGTMLQRDAAREDSAKELLVFVRQCWIVKPEFKHIVLKKLKDVTEEMVVLTFPEHATFKGLYKKLIDNERTFRNQQLNEPSDAEEDSDFVITFTEDALRANSMPLAGVPSYGDVVMAGDTAVSIRATADFTAFAVGKIWQVPKVRPDEATRYGLTILKVVFGKWTQTEIAINLVKLNCEYSLSRPILIEKAAGAETLQEKINQESLRRCGKRAQISFVPPSNVKNAKATNIKGLEILLNEGRLKFVNGPWMDEMYSQFTSFTTKPGNKGRKDDIPDVISSLAKFLPAASQPYANLDAIKKEAEERNYKALKEQQYNAVFGQSHEQPRNFVAPPAFATRPTNNTNSDVYRQAMKRIFGRS